MSEFLLHKTVKIDAGQSRYATMQQFRGYLTTAGWQVAFESAANLDPPTLAVYPPAAEATGNAKGREVVQLLFEASVVRFRTGYLNAETSKKSYLIRATYASSTVAIKFGQQVFSVVVPSGSDHNSATTALYNTLASSNTPEARGYSFSIGSYPDGYLYILASEAAVGGGALPTSVSYVAIKSKTLAATANSLLDRGAALSGNSFTVATDYGAGWVAFFTVMSRSVALASRTLAGYGGPVSAAYMGRTESLGQQPNPDSPLVELALIRNGEGNECVVSWGMYYGYASAPIQADATQVNAIAPISGAAPQPYSAPVASAYVASSASSEPNVVAYGAGMENAPKANANAAMFGYDPPLAGVYVPSRLERGYNDFAALWSPTASFPDVAISLASGGDENVFVSSEHHSTRYTTLAAALDAAATSLQVSDGSIFPAAGGTVNVGAEVMLYASRSGNTLSGLTRGYNSSPVGSYLVGERAFLGMWWVKIRGGLLCVGHKIPANV